MAGTQWRFGSPALPLFVSPAPQLRRFRVVVKVVRLRFVILMADGFISSLTRKQRIKIHFT